MDARTAVGDAAIVQAVFDETIALHRRMRDVMQESVIEAAAAVRASLEAGGKRLVFGNGGSAADAQHLAAEFVGRFERERGYRLDRRRERYDEPGQRFYVRAGDRKSVV